MPESLPAPRPIPSCIEGLDGIASNQLITDIIAPELMNVAGPQEVTYERLHAITHQPYKPEYGTASIAPEPETEPEPIPRPIAATGLLRRFLSRSVGNV